VDPDEQGLGAGAMLLKAAERHARDEMGAIVAVLWVSNQEHYWSVNPEVFLMLSSFNPHDPFLWF